MCTPGVSLEECDSVSFPSVASRCERERDGAQDGPLSVASSSHEPVDEHEESEDEANEVAHVLGATGVDLDRPQRTQ